MRIVWLGSLLAVASLGVASVSCAPAQAQTPTPAQTQPRVATIIGPPPSEPVSEANCVLHIWPGADAHSSYTGWFHGGAVDGDRRGIKGYPDMHGAALNVAAQHELLTKVNWAERRQRPGLIVVVHDAPPPPADDLGRTTALIADHAACYDELLVHSVFVEGATFSSKSVRLMMIAKRWRGSDGPATYSAMSVEKVDLKAVEPGAIDASLRGGFMSAIEHYLQNEHFLRRD